MLPPVLKKQILGSFQQKQHSQGVSLVRAELLCRMCRILCALGMWLCWAPLLLTARARARRFLCEAFGLTDVGKEDETPVLAEIFLS